MLPSSFAISQMMPAGTIPARRARSKGLPSARRNQHSAFARAERKTCRDAPGLSAWSRDRSPPELCARS
jgi:hypothetical protein